MREEKNLWTDAAVRIDVMFVATATDDEHPVIQQRRCMSCTSTCSDFKCNTSVIVAFFFTRDRILLGQSLRYHLDAILSHNFLWSMILDLVAGSIP